MAPCAARPGQRSLLFRVGSPALLALVVALLLVARDDVIDAQQQHCRLGGDRAQEVGGAGRTPLPDTGPLAITTFPGRDPLRPACATEEGGCDALGSSGDPLLPVPPPSTRPHSTARAGRLTSTAVLYVCSFTASGSQMPSSFMSTNVPVSPFTPQVSQSSWVCLACGGSGREQ